MLGASLSEVWGDDFKEKKKNKKKKLKPLTPAEMESELLVKDTDRVGFETDEFRRHKMLRDDRFLDNSKPVNYTNSNIVSSMNPYGKIPEKLEDDPDYNEFLEFKRNKYNSNNSNTNNSKGHAEELIPIDMNYQLNELLLYVFTGFFLLILYDNIYRLGIKSY